MGREIESLKKAESLARHWKVLFHVIGLNEMQLLSYSC